MTRPAAKPPARMVYIPGFRLMISRKGCAGNIPDGENTHLIGEKYMTDLDPRIKTALLSVNPTSENPAWHGCPTALGVLRGVSAALATWRPTPHGNNIREIALHIAFCENSVANSLSGKVHRLGLK